MSNYLTDEERDTHFRKLADRFIDTANRQTEDTEPTVINSAFLYAASRFCAFVIANKAAGKDRYNKLKPEALEYYSDEFNKMLAQNLDNYAEIFDDESDTDDELSH